MQNKSRCPPLTLSFSELGALHYWLLAIMQHSRQLVRQSIHYHIQIEVLGEILVKKIHPKTLVDPGRPIRIQLRTVEHLALQAAHYNGWGQYNPDFYVQNVIRSIVMHQLPNVAVPEEGYLVAPDLGWEEE